MTRAARWCWAVAVATALGACAATSGPQPAPPLEGEGLRGEQIELAGLRGDVVVVTVWASWCAPCRDEVPVLHRALQRWDDQGFAVVGVNFRDHPDAAAQFVEQEQVAFPSVADPEGAIAVSWGVRGLPQTFLIDRSGDVAARKVGPVDDAWIDDVVAPEVAS
ncbi:TlpA family protein disulfide reductase [Demequina sp. SO4-13]|uniref:TlpA family protein disulfide reductase n=1 Tax=Demequina sp. SO4-13 TaxID=3401027 RepID=UPI003AF7044C